MRRAISIALAALVLAAPAALAAHEFSLGASLGLFAFGDQKAYEGRSMLYLTSLGGDTSASRRADWAVVPSLTQDWRFHRFAAVELKERFWQSAIKGVFGSAALDYRLARTVIPLTLALKLILTNSDSDAGVTLSAGPGLYVLSTDERGAFGSGADTAPRFGGHLTGGFFVRMYGPLYLRADIGYDWFSIPQQNPFMDDGGAGGGLTVTGGVDLTL